MCPILRVQFPEWLWGPVRRRVRFPTTTASRESRLQLWLRCPRGCLCLRTVRTIWFPARETRDSGTGKNAWQHILTQAKGKTQDGFIIYLSCFLHRGGHAPPQRIPRTWIFYLEGFHWYFPLHFSIALRADFFSGLPSSNYSCMSSPKRFHVLKWPGMPKEKIRIKIGIF